MTTNTAQLNPMQRIAGRHGFGPNGILTHRTATVHGWVVPKKKNPAQELFVSDEGDSVINIYSVPKYSLIGQITDGISEPEGITTDRFGTLYVANLGNDTVTIYAKGTMSPAATLSEPNGPDDVAVDKSGRVFAADIGGGVDVYGQPFYLSVPQQRITNADIFEVFGVAVDKRGDIYAAGLGPGSQPVIITYHWDSGYEWAPGVNLYLSGMDIPSGVLLNDSHDHIYFVESDYGLGVINIYDGFDTGPSSTIPISHPERSALDRRGKRIYVPQGSDDKVAILKYPSGTPVASISIGNFVSGTAIFPPRKF